MKVYVIHCVVIWSFLHQCLMLSVLWKLFSAPKPDSQTTTTSQNSSQSPSPTSSPALNEPSVVQDQHKWTIYQSCVNLPALLNDPRLTRREIDIFSKTWGESFERAVVQPSTHIPNITRDHFRRYIKRTSKVCYVLKLFISLLKIIII